jgi:hypothetical protein
MEAFDGALPEEYKGRIFLRLAWNLPGGVRIGWFEAGLREAPRRMKERSYRNYVRLGGLAFSWGRILWVELEPKAQSQSKI